MVAFTVCTKHKVILSRVCMFPDSCARIPNRRRCRLQIRHIMSFGRQRHPRSPFSCVELGSTRWRLHLTVAPSSTCPAQSASGSESVRARATAKDSKTRTALLCTMQPSLPFKPMPVPPVMLARLACVSVLRSFVREWNDVSTKNSTALLFRAQETSLQYIDFRGVC